ncbi:hypothetical protein L228DRAFT_281383 [Xylona heveae TC161]|uniref:NIMA interactive protein n=1 Tax=Xylona heveae (strain CBS 132557 / TC161) TaxID=1328760 RepID=A0A165I2W8_XYLHT|nr:hypothetical protein L228DRAFT_281383 [Xylona heveae TC161]KZF24295.1 hypothetical protein L228DRAFT_281383 [Xylona heveae TC161]
MDPESLATASTYLNNLLLARGLLRSGKPVEFSRPSRGEGGKEATYGKIINLVHDLVLRRDREAEQRENLANTIRTLRRNEAGNNLEMERLRERNADLTRQLALAQGQERVYKSSIRTAEASARSHRDEMLRMKSLLQQVRTQCANDIRKRDMQIQKLKHHLATQQRGTRSGLVHSTMTISPITPSMAASKAERHSSPDSSDLSLKQETTEFLTNFSQQLSDENDNLIGLITSSTSTLRSLQGLPPASHSGFSVSEEFQEGGLDNSSEMELVSCVPTSYEELAVDMDEVLEHLRTILTNPNFVPLEELEIREDEVVRLREGWEKMEERWREAVTMMDSWRKRMVSGGETINLDELKAGLKLGQGLETLTPRTIARSHPKKSPNRKEAHEQLTQGEVPLQPRGNSKEQIEGEEEGWEEDEQASDEEEDELAFSQPSPASRRHLSVLGEQSGNAQPTRSPRKVSFQDIPEEEDSQQPEGRINGGLGVIPDLKATPHKLSPEKSSRESTQSRSPRQTPKQISTPLTVRQKLENARAEAEATKSGRRRKSITRRSGVRSGRRRSTLSKEELDALIGRVDSL